MDFNALMQLSLAVLKDWHVIFIAIVFLFSIAVVNYVVKYKKKPAVHTHRVARHLRKSQKRKERQRNLKTRF